MYAGRTVFWGYQNRAPPRHQLLLDRHPLHLTGLGVDRRGQARAVPHLKADLDLHADRLVGTDVEGADLLAALDVADRRVIRITGDDHGTSGDRVDEVHRAAVFGITPDDLDTVVLARLQVSRPLDDLALRPVVRRNVTLLDRDGRGGGLLGVLQRHVHRVGAGREAREAEGDRATGRNRLLHRLAADGDDGGVRGVVGVANGAADDAGRLAGLDTGLRLRRDGRLLELHRGRRGDRDPDASGCDPAAERVLDLLEGHGPRSYAAVGDRLGQRACLHALLDAYRHRGLAADPARRAGVGLQSHVERDRELPLALRERVSGGCGALDLAGAGLAAHLLHDLRVERSRDVEHVGRDLGRWRHGRGVSVRGRGDRGQPHRDDERGQDGENELADHDVLLDVERGIQPRMVVG